MQYELFVFRANDNVMVFANIISVRPPTTDDICETELGTMRHHDQCDDHGDGSHLEEFGVLVSGGTNVYATYTKWIGALPDMPSPPALLLRQR